jgi:hypothetical protein
VTVFKRVFGPRKTPWTHDDPSTTTERAIALVFILLTLPLWIIAALVVAVGVVVNLATEDRRP